MRIPITALAGAIVATGLVGSPATVHAQLTVSARAEAAITLPSVAVELRATGVPAEEVEIALVEVRTRRLPAPEVHLIFTNTIEVVHVHGPLPHFGGFVRMRLRDGYRGPRLYESIRVEHAHGPHGRAKGYYGHPHGGPPGQRGMGNVHIRGGAPHMATVHVRGGAPHMATVRVRGGGAPHMATVRVRGGGGGGGSVRVRAGGGGGGGHGGGGMGMH